ncbi:MAG: 50S ribosomal protein L3 [Planctomycetes bacterium]|nr:50S ribosomal protein L3 [Planctomycetota bacterium]
MVQAILGKKVGMSQIFSEKGEVLPVTLLEVGPCPILQIKTKETDGYTAIQLGFDEKKIKGGKKRKFRRALKPEIGHAKKAETTPKRFVREVPWDGTGDYKLGQVLTAEVLKDIRYVDVVGTSKGRGFAGVVKRYHFAGGPHTHGQHNRERHRGSLGQATHPGRVFKGIRMAGHMGVARVTLQNVKLVTVDAAKNLIAVKGAVPGHNGSYVLVKKALKRA